MAQNSAHQITLALLNYEMAHGEFPATQTMGDGSKPLMNWRVEVLPFLEEATIYGSLQRDQAWNGPANLPFTNLSVRAFTSPRCPDQRGLAVAMADGMVLTLPPSTSKETIIQMFNCSDGAASTW